MNQLINETSPYLLQHAHNPVNWYAWKPETLALAQAENKPILVSIGYSTCHWCHVMERESFEDERVAAFMNQNFINIKVDREERPDIDHIYMEVCQILSGNGGWPLNCFLLPDGKPFFAGTYYPPRSAHNRPSWMEVLKNISTSFQHRRQVVEEQASRLMSYLNKSDTKFIDQKIADLNPKNVFSQDFLDKIYAELYERFDRIDGGFGLAPKFPNSMSIQYLMRYHALTGNQEALNHALFSLDKMLMGGIYDQIGGGFARYATDNAWLIPHFEKMLYDNALLIITLCDAYKITLHERYRETIEDTLAFIQRELTSPEGGFYAALDADSEGKEGKFYVWEKSEIDSILGKDADIFCRFYGVTEEGNWEEQNIIWREHLEADFARQENLSEQALKYKLKDCCAKLLIARAKRIRPSLDNKIILSWNALQCTAYCHAYTALQDENYKKIALKNLDFLLKKFGQEGAAALLHTYAEKSQQANYQAFLEDYAFLIEALIEVYQISFDTNLLQKATLFADFVIENFFDSTQNLFYFTSVQQVDLVTRKKELYDSATPSGNSTMVHNLQRLGILLDNEHYKNIAHKMLLAMQKTVKQYPSSFAKWAMAIMNEVKPILEIAIVGKSAENLAKDVNKLFLPNKILAATTIENNDLPLLVDKPILSETLIYVCENYQCKMPVTTAQAILLS